MPTPIIVPVQHVREVECIVEGGVKYCEKVDVNPKELGIALLGVIAWIAAICFCVGKSIDSPISEEKAWLLLAGLILLAPIFAMIAFG